MFLHAEIVPKTNIRFVNYIKNIKNGDACDMRIDKYMMKGKCKKPAKMYTFNLTFPYVGEV